MTRAAATEREMDEAEHKRVDDAAHSRIDEAAHIRATDKKVDMAAHRRIDEVEKRLDTHLGLIENLGISIKENTSSLAENTRLTQEVANNTGELVDLFKGAKAFRKFFLWAAGIASATTALIALIVIIWHWFTGE